jgi:hypothetical protein
VDYFGADDREEDAPTRPGNDDALRTYLSLVMLQALRALLLLSSIVVLDLAFDPCSYEY